MEYRDGWKGGGILHENGANCNVKKKKLTRIDVESFFSCFLFNFSEYIQGTF